MLNEKLEILSIDYLQPHQELINDLKLLANFIGLSIGWHYPLDWAWIISQLGDLEGKTILDAGAGRGVLQWYAAEKGASVYSVDRDSRACLPLHIRQRYTVQGLRPQDLLPPGDMVNPFERSTPLNAKVIGLLRSAIGLSRARFPGLANGKVFIYNQDLRHLDHIAANSIDAVISVSALEHNPPQNLEGVIRELLRVLKPGGVILATLAAARDRDWFHEPSKGWCYTEKTLRNTFGLSAEVPSNYNRYDDLFTALKQCADLSQDLSRAYYRSRGNGMPLGKWAPEYQPVGVLKIKDIS